MKTYTQISTVFKSSVLTALALIAGTLFGSMQVLATETITIETYQPHGKDTFFPVTSNLLWADADNQVLLIDAQFSAKDAHALVKRIKDSGKELKTIFISHGDPDYYFGLAVITDAFPQANVLANPAVVKHIQQTQAAKLAHWGPLLGTQAPSRIVVPTALKKDSIEFAGHRVEVVGVNSIAPERSSLWIPEFKTVLGGILVDSGEHVWVADTPTKASREAWINSLDQLLALQPEKVIPGHYTGKLPEGDAAIRFTKEYLINFEQELAKAKNSAELIKAMEQLYPQLEGKEALELSAKVLTGEIQWE